jgi:MFS family permease
VIAISSEDARSPVLPFIEADFNISPAQSALLMSSYLPYAIVRQQATQRQFGNGVMLLAMAGTSLGSILVGLSTTLELALAARIFAGSLSGFWFASSTKIIIQNTGSARQGRALGITYSGGAIASILIYLTVGSLSNLRIGWRPFFIVGSLPGFICLAMTLPHEGPEGKSRREGALRKPVWRRSRSNSREDQ